MIIAHDSKRAMLMMARLKLWAFERRQWERYDRCCHGGVISYRLPLMQRIEIANNPIRAKEPTAPKPVHEVK